MKVSLMRMLNSDRSKHFGLVLVRAAMIWENALFRLN
jgi:hypothetical protein